MTIQTSTTQTEQWIRTRDNRTGRQLAVAVPSKSQAGKFHLVTLAGCDCRGWKFRGTCAHLVAVQAEADRVRADQAPAPIVEPEVIRCVCGNYHRTDAERIAAHPDANRALADGGAAHLRVMRAAGQWPS